MLFTDIKPYQFKKRYLYLEVVASNNSLLFYDNKLEEIIYELPNFK